MQVTYLVSITNPSATGIGAGFIDTISAQTYGVGSITAIQSANKKRGNLRHKFILEALGNMANVTVVAVNVPGGSASAEPTSIEYTLSFPSSAALKIVRDEEVIEGSLAVKHVIAEALAFDQTRRCDYYKPLAIAIIEDLVVGKIAANVTAAKSLITITTL